MQWRGNTHIVLAASILLTVGLIFALIYFDASMTQTDSRSTDLSEITDEEEHIRVEYARYVVWTLKFRESTFEWSLRSTKIIFWVSMLISVSGIMFAFWQFLDAGQKDQRAAEADELEIKTQLASIAFKSRSLASLVLFVSIAYLLIYVRFVHPINETHDKLGTQAASQVVSGGGGSQGGTTGPADEKMPQDGPVAGAQQQPGDQKMPEDEPSTLVTQPSERPGEETTPIEGLQNPAPAEMPVSGDAGAPMPPPEPAVQGIPEPPQPAEKAKDLTEN